MNVHTTVTMLADADGAPRVVAGVEGIVDLSSVGTLHMDLTTAVRRSPGATLFVDLDGARAIDDAGLGVLLGAAAAARDAGGELIIVCSRNSLRARLAHTRLDRAIAVRERIADGGGSPSEPIHHIALVDDWAAAQATGEYRCSTRGQSLEEVGFIHCSTAAQLAGTMRRFYGDLAEVIVLTIDPTLVDAPLVYEPPTPGADDLFPHLYGPLPLTAVIDASPATPNRPDAG